MPSELTEYRPNATLGYVFAGVFTATAAILVWLGIVLSPDDRAAMDGWTLLLFTVVPIPLFSWTAAAVFLILGVRIARRSMRAQPTMLVSDAGVTLPTGTLVPWSRLASVKASETELRLTLLANSDAPPKTPKLWLVWLRWLRRDEDKIILSSFELGADPAAVAEAIESRRAPHGG